MASPLMAVALGEARNATTWAISCAVMILRVRLRPAMRCSISASAIPCALACAATTPGVFSGIRAELQHLDAVADARDLGRGRVQRRLVAGDDGDIGALLGQLERDRLADAAVAAGDDGHLAFELEVHGLSPFVGRLCRPI